MASKVSQIFKNGHFIYRFICNTRGCGQRSFKTLAALNADALRVNMPALSPTMQEGTILKWLKKEGDTVSPGDVLCEIQTDKAVVTMDTDEEGILAKILKPDNSNNVQVGTLIALLVEEGEDWQNVEVPEDTGSSEQTGETIGEVAHATQERHSTSLGPAVRHIVDMYGLDPDQIRGTGPHGRLLKGDVLNYIAEKGLKAVPPKSVPVPAGQVVETPKGQVQAGAKPPVVPKPPTPTPVVDRDGQEYIDIPVTSMRRTIAKRLTESKITIPHTYATIDCKMDNLIALRKNLIADGVKVSVNDFIIKAAAVALQKVPEMNSLWTAEGPRLLQNIDICVAVATDNGLITPIVTDAIGLGLQEISSKVKDLSTRARQGKLLPKEFQGGTFTISNLGMFGITEFSAVINPPQASILAIGTSRQELDVEAQPQTLMTVTLSADARMVSEDLKSRFLEAFRDQIQNPMLMLSQSVPVRLEKLFAS